MADTHGLLDSEESPALLQQVAKLSAVVLWPTCNVMQLEWDEEKSDACLAERGFDFAYAARVFLDPQRLVQPDSRYEYGEPRYRVLGEIEGRLFMVVYTPRGGRLRLISARKANKREVQLYGASAGDA